MKKSWASVSARGLRAPSLATVSYFLVLRVSNGFFFSDFSFNFSVMSPRVHVAMHAQLHAWLFVTMDHSLSFCHEIALWGYWSGLWHFHEDLLTQGLNLISLCLYCRWSLQYHLLVPVKLSQAVMLWGPSQEWELLGGGWCVCQVQTHGQYL